MERLKLFDTYQHLFKSIPLSVWISSGVVVLLVLSYSFLFLVPKHLQFSYGAESCTSAVVLAPGLQQSASEEFTLTFKDEWRIGSVSLVATKVCAQPKQSPKAGAHITRTAPGGSWFASRAVVVQVPTTPSVEGGSLDGRSISTALPLKVALSQQDTIHTYELLAAQARTLCMADGGSLLCDMSGLQLAQGTQYSLELRRSFKGTQVATVAKGTVTTLVPITVASSSLTQDQTIFDIPQDFAFSFDKTVKSATVQLKNEAGTVIPTRTDIDQQTVRITPVDALARKTRYVLTISQVISTEGNALATPVVVPFTLSGGPKVAGVSVGTTNVDRAARILVTFDQPLHDDVDIIKFARIAGIPGTVSKVSSTQFAVKLTGAQLCQSFTLTLDKGVKSGTNNELSDEPWSFSSRTVCGYSTVIGYSVRGRPIIAYYFGNGSNTILFTGGIHGEEQSGQQTMQAWADYLMANGDKIPADKQIVVVPNLNPDGIALGVRNNANNVNLGRNYPSYNWQASIDTASGILPTGGGTSAGSEPETKAIMALTAQLKPRLGVSFHAQGRLVGANKVKDSVAIGDTYARAVGYSTMFSNAEEVMGYSITGEYEEWLGESFGIPAILIELPTRQGNYLSSQLSALVKLLTV